ncbi:MAG: glycosyltransferase [Flavobacteriales bacterium]|nr:glycosyltransferase [Flavobacteriales bacterium]
MIATAIESVRAQSYCHWELIVIDDGSDDDTESVVTSYKDQRIRYIRQVHAERSAARNRGMALSKGDWVCFLDSDDYYLENHLEVLAGYIEKNRLGEAMVLTGIEIEDASSGSRIKHPLIKTQQVNVLKEIWETFILMDTVCVSRKILDHHRFDVRFNLWEDTHLWLRIASRYRLCQIASYTCVQRNHTANSVVLGMQRVRLHNVRQYMLAIDDLFLHHAASVGSFLSDDDRIEYKNRKLAMYLYQAGMNGQIRAALVIWWMAIINKPSLYLWLEFPKIFLRPLKRK